MSWEGILFLFARWPWAVLGVLAAVRDRLMGTSADFRVTPKGTDAADPLPLRLLAPYAVLSLLSGIPVLLIDNVEVARGFYLFAALNAVLYATLLLVIVRQHARENPVKLDTADASMTHAMAPRIATATMVATAMSVAIVGAQQTAQGGGAALVWGAECLVKECQMQAGWAGRPSDTGPSFVYIR